MDLLGLIQILLVGLGSAAAILTLWTYRQVRRPKRWTYATAVARNEPGDPSELDAPRQFVTWSFRDPASRAALPVWDIAGDAPDGPVAILTPGWSESSVSALSRVGAIAPMCSRVVVWDPPGEGEAAGSCSMGAREPVALAALVERIVADAPEARIAHFGWSMGAGISIAAAAGARASQHTLCVIAEAPFRSPFTPVKNVAIQWGLPHWPNVPVAVGLLGLRLGQGARWRNYDRAAWARRLSCPLLVMHGDADDICPHADGADIANAARRGLLLTIAGAGHANIWTEPAFAKQATAAVRDFLRASALQSSKVVVAQG